MPLYLANWFNPIPPGYWTRMWSYPENTPIGVETRHMEKCVMVVCVRGADTAALSPCWLDSWTDLISGQRDEPEYQNPSLYYCSQSRGEREAIEQEKDKDTELWSLFLSVNNITRRMMKYCLKIIIIGLNKSWHDHHNYFAHYWDDGYLI